MPVRNGENLLREALDLFAEHANIYTISELFAFTTINRSTDRTAEVCEAIADSRTQRIGIDAAENLGAVGNFNYVFATHTRGEILQMASRAMMFATLRFWRDALEGNSK